jgi:chromate transporter
MHPQLTRPAPSPEGASTVLYAFRDLLLYFLRLGTLGFGGPIALAGRMQKDLVEERRSLSRTIWRVWLFSQLSPGRLAAQLAMYLGWTRAGATGATLVGIAFILPSFLMVLLLAALYIHFGSLSWIQGMFYGIGAAVIAIIVRSAVKLIRTTIGKDWLLGTIFAALAITTAWTKYEIVWLFVLCGAVAVLVKAPPAVPARATSMMFSGGMGSLLTGIHGVSSIAAMGVLFLFFLKAGAFVFGSGLAIVPFLYGGVVGKFHWLTERQFVDAVAVAMITPGPVVITAAFIGYLVAGPLGALVAGVAVFAPPYFIVLFGAPYYRRFAQNPRVKAFVQGVTAAAVGAIAGAAYILARRSLVDVPTLLIGLITLTILMFTKRVPEPLVILAAGAVGMLVHGTTG